MSARAPLYALLSNDLQAEEPGSLGSLGFEKIYTQNAVDTPGEDRFIVIRGEQPDARAYGDRASDHFTIWFHDKDRAYDTIDLGIERLKALVKDAVHLAGEDGWVLTQAHWNTDSNDLADDGYHTVVRWSDITVNSRYDGV